MLMFVGQRTAIYELEQQLGPVLLEISRAVTRTSLVARADWTRLTVVLSLVVAGSGWIVMQESKEELDDSFVLGRSLARSASPLVGHRNGSPWSVSPST